MVRGRVATGERLEVKCVEPADLRHQPLQRAHELVVARRLQQHAVEGVVEVDRADHVAALERPRAVAVERAHAVVVGGGQRGHAEPGPERVERRDDRERLGGPLGADRGNARLAVGDRLDQPLGLQALERLADGMRLVSNCSASSASRMRSPGGSEPVTIASSSVS